MTPRERQYLGVSSAQLSVEISDFTWLTVSPAEYVIYVRRVDQMPMSEVELRSLLANLSWAVEGEESLINLRRA